MTRTQKVLIFLGVLALIVAYLFVLRSWVNEDPKLYPKGPRPPAAAPQPKGPDSPK
jgi:hypothetical protein